MGRGQPPAYVFAIRADRVLMSGDLSAVFRMLKECKYRDRVIRETPAVLAVRFPAQAPDLLENQDLHALLSWLSEHGVAFSEGAKHDRAAVDFAQELQGKGLLPKRITIIDWSSPDQWKVRELLVTHPPHEGTAARVR